MSYIEHTGKEERVFFQHNNEEYIGVIAASNSFASIYKDGKFVRYIMPQDVQSSRWPTSTDDLVKAFVKVYGQY